jgi:hypothetical protein
MKRKKGAGAAYVGVNGRDRDHGKLKRVIQPTLGFQSMRTARATSRGSR